MSPGHTGRPRVTAAILPPSTPLRLPSTPPRPLISDHILSHLSLFSSLYRCPPRLNFKRLLPRVPLLLTSSECKKKNSRKTTDAAPSSTRSLDGRFFCFLFFLLLYFCFVSLLFLFLYTSIRPPRAGLTLRKISKKSLRFILFFCSVSINVSYPESNYRVRASRSGLVIRRIVGIRFFYSFNWKNAITIFDWFRI